MLELMWVIDSPYSRCIKWLLLNKQIAHQDVLFSWSEMVEDPALAAANPKRQVPTLLDGEQVKTDSLLIALGYLPSDWYTSVDAKLFRLADAEVEATIIFLFRAKLLKDKFGASAHSQLMFDAGVNTYKMSIDLLLDHLWQPNTPVNVGAVLLFSTLLAARAFMSSAEKLYRAAQLSDFIATIEQDSSYQYMIEHYQGQQNNEVPLVWR